MSFVSLALASTLLVAAASLPGALTNAVPQDPEEQRAQEVSHLFSARPTGYETIFDPGFLHAVPPSQLDHLFAQYFQTGGKVIGMARAKPDAPWPAKFVFRTEKGFTVSANLKVDPTGQHLVQGLVLGVAIPELKDFNALYSEFKRLPGQVSFQAARLAADGPHVVAQLDPDHALGLGSAFKLFILGALIEDISTGKRHWNDVIELQTPLKSLPSGILQDWPSGAPLTLHSLATLMISRSDNTATDHLLATLGRERVEAMMGPMGVQDANRSLPLLSTRELFLLKWGPGRNALDAYHRESLQARRARVASLASAKLSEIQFGATPIDVEHTEWFASSSDLTRMLAWLQLHTEAGEAAKAREILAVNPGLAFDRSAWPYVGYKGGSEPGVLALAFLLRSAKGDWYTLSAVWNDPQAVLAEDRFLALATRASELLSAGVL